MYDDNTPVKRKDLWEILTNVKATIGQQDWLIVGNFITIRSPKERDGISSFDLQATTDFNLAVDGLNELDIVGGGFTWSNQSTINSIHPKIDIMFANDKWLGH